MSKALTPSQLKAELETQKDALLKACLYALNEIPKPFWQKSRNAVHTAVMASEKIPSGAWQSRCAKMPPAIER